MELPTTLQMAILRAPWSFTSRRAARVSAVSPDWEIGTARTRPSRWLPVTGLGSNIHLHRQPGEGLDQIFAHHGGVEGGAAGNKAEPIQPHEVPVRDTQLRNPDLSCLQVRPIPHAVSDGLWLLKDLLEHEMGEAPLLSRLSAPREETRGPSDRKTIKGLYGDRLTSQDRKLSLLQDQDLPRLPEQRRDVRGEEDLAIPALL